MLLLDYVLITALLLVTDLQEWMVVRKYEGKGLHLSGSSGQGSSSMPDLPSTSDPKFRKIMFGEPIYPKIAAGAESRSRLSEGSSSLSPTTPGFPRTPTSGGASIHDPEFDYSPLRPASPKTTMAPMVSSEDDEDEDDNDGEDTFFDDTRPSSVLAESFHYSSAAPSHPHIDPSFYGISQSRPPVPQIPTQFKSLNGRGFSSQPSTPISMTFRPIRDLPPPPPESLLQDSGDSQVARSNSVRSYTFNLSRPGSPSTPRPLPPPPPVPPISSGPPLARRVQSSNQLRNDASFAALTSPSRPMRSLPPTPSIGRSHVPPLPPAPETVPEEQMHIESDGGSVRVSHHSHSRQPPITKASQEDLRNWVHMLTTPQRDLPPAPLPSSSIFDVPPPAYNTIDFSRQRQRSLPVVHAAASPADLP